jgi:transcriptional regulator GlxA family with amidase domain
MKSLQRIRLERAREDLLTAPPGTLTITGVANKWGFVHLGRFAAAYSQQFSELPSDTIRLTATTMARHPHTLSDSD